MSDRAQRWTAEGKRKLKESGLTIKDAERLGIEQLSAAETAKLGVKDQNSDLLLIRYFTPDGQPQRSRTGQAPYYRIRYLGSSNGFDRLTGKDARYRQPPDSGMCEYYPQGFIDWPKVLGDPEETIYIAEGELKASAGCKAGYPTIGLSGVDGWHARKAGHSLLPGLASIDWRGRHVYIVFDSDIKTNRHVRRAANRLAAELMRRGAIVYVIELPNASRNGHAKTGLDDYLVKKGEAAFARIIKRTPVAEVEEDHLTDMGNAQRFAADHAGSVLFDHTRKCWFSFSGTHWARQKTGEVMRKGRETVSNIYRIAAETKDDDERKRLVSHAQASESERALRAMLSLAQSEEELAVSAEALDQNGKLVNLTNGTLDLETIRLRDHDPADLITHVLSVAYDRRAKAKRWLSFLARVLDNDKDLIRFVQRAVGYSLTGSTREQCFFLLYGTGANGKSTFIETLHTLLGPLAQSARFESFLVKKGDTIPNDIARMHGARFVSAVEASGERRLDEPTIKSLTGGDTITARFMRGEFFDFKPAFKLWLAANHKPIIQGTDLAIWRRVKLIPFTVTIPEKERDPDLPDKLAEELPGILAWAVEGCRQYQRYGLGRCRAVEAHTAAYKSEQDILREFIDDVCVLGPLQQVTKPLLYLRYSNWAKGNGHHPMANNTLARRLVEQFPELRTKRDRKEGVRYWLGIGVREGGSKC